MSATAGAADPRPQAVTETLHLRFSATQCEPMYREIFMATGGQINAAATPWHTDFAITGSTHSVVTDVSNGVTEEVSIELPKGSWKWGKRDDRDVVQLGAPMRLNVSTSRMGCAINGTLVSSCSGQGSNHLSTLIKPTGHSQIGLIYCSWLAHAATTGLSGMRVVQVDSDGRESTPRHLEFVPREAEVADKLSRAAAIVNAYVQQAWTLRQSLVYKPSPMLTKSVFKDVVGIDSQGYALLTDIVQRKAPMSLKALDSLFRAGLQTDCCHDRKDYDSFMSATTTPESGCLTRSP